MGVCDFLCTAANWWERSPNSSNSTNFCNVNTNGNANNNNAYNSLGVAPDFVSQKWYGSNAVTRCRVNYDPYERRDISRDENPKLSFDVQARTLLAWWEDLCLLLFHVHGQSSLAALYITTVRRTNIFYDKRRAPYGALSKEKRKKTTEKRTAQPVCWRIKQCVRIS